MYWLTLPAWGMTQGGELYELPTPVLPTDASAFSSLPTPTARDYKDQQIGSPYKMQSRFGDSELPTAIAMLPTPMAADGTKASTNPDTSARRIEQGRQPFLTDIVQTALLPTPTAQQGLNQTSGRQPGAVFNSGTTLQDVIYSGSLGASTSPPSDAGSDSPDPHPLPLWTDATDDPA